MSDKPFYGHSAPRFEDWEPLALHIRRVASRARANASAFGAEDEAHLIALLHDLGKYSNLFTKRLHGEASGLDHWSIGAWAAWEHLGRNGAAAALAIEGHHIGLQNGFTLPSTTTRINPDKLRAGPRSGGIWTETDADRALTHLIDDGFSLPFVEQSFVPLYVHRVRSMLTTRLLFSALVDADFIATSEHFCQVEGRPFERTASEMLDAARALDVVHDHIERIAATSKAAAHVDSLRNDLLRDCLASADRDPGLFTLTAPTGTGKTLAMLAFALRHAKKHGMRRVIFAIPYLSILEQTARVYRELFEPEFGDHFVLEHHSLANRATKSSDRDDVDEQTAADARARLLTENWDAPIVLTTNVQLLESLFAHRPSRCRKLHNVAGSVILFDEAQSLPLELALPTLGALRSLTEDAGCSVVFATATQPAFTHLDEAVKRYPQLDREPHPGSLGWQPREIVSAMPAMFRAAKRVVVDWLPGKLTWDALAERIFEDGTQALVVLNLKRHAMALFETLEARNVEGLFHLSTNLCPLHRVAVLKAAQARLDRDEPCILISTQCIEAGVDIDFPRVYRALGPLDAIAQAAGRCNRNGLGEADGMVVVFRPDSEGKPYPPGIYATASNVTASQLNEHGSLDINDPATFTRYFEALYNLIGITDADDSDDLADAIYNLRYPEVAKRYRVIKQDTVQVVVPFDTKHFAKLRARLNRVGHLDRKWISMARPLAVGLQRPKPEKWPAGLEGVPIRHNAVADDWFLLVNPDEYHQDLGLQLRSNLWIA